MSSSQKKQQQRALRAAAERRSAEQEAAAPTGGVAKLKQSLGIPDPPAAPQRRDPSRPKVHARTAHREEQKQAETKQSLSERSAQRRKDTNQPPLGLSLGAIMVMGFAAMMLLQGVVGLSKGAGLLGALLAGFGGLFLVSAFFTYRRQGWAWAVCVLGSGFASGALIAMTLVMPDDLLARIGASRMTPLIYSIFFLCPLLLLLLPGSRADLQWRRKPVRASRAEADEED